MSSTMQSSALLDPPEVALESQSPAMSSDASDDEIRVTPRTTGITVIIPVRNDPDNLERCLDALSRSQETNFEIIVVDDASTDHTTEVAERFDVRLLRQTERSGPAGARNRGARLANYPHLFFVDADVCVKPDTVAEMLAQFERFPDVDAFFGSYDDTPGHPNVLSQYRNLLHHFVHQRGNRQAFSFWSGCGAVRTSVFLALGGFDTSYDNASVEDIELGDRLKRHGHTVQLVKSIQVTHLKRWTLWNMILTDIRKRAIPWTQLLLRQGKIPNDLNLRYSQRLSAVFAGGLASALALGSWFHPSMLIFLLLPTVALLLIDRWSWNRPVPSWGRWLVGLGVVAVATAALLFTGVGGTCGNSGPWRQRSAWRGWWASTGVSTPSWRGSSSPCSPSWCYPPTCSTTSTAAPPSSSVRCSSTWAVVAATAPESPGRRHGFPPPHPLLVPQVLDGLLQTRHARDVQPVLAMESRLPSFQQSLGRLLRPFSARSAWRR